MSIPGYVIDFKIFVIKWNYSVASCDNLLELSTRIEIYVYKHATTETSLKGQAKLEFSENQGCIIVLLAWIQNSRTLQVVTF